MATNAAVTNLIGLPASIFTSAPSVTTTGTPKHYLPVELVPPTGASTALKSFIAMAETAIQTAVDLLGRGVPVPPPEVGDLLRTVVYQDLGKGTTTVAYQQALSNVQARQTALLTFDNKVAETAIVVAAKKDETLAAIKGIVYDLQTKLKPPITGKHKATQEATLMEQIATAVDSVYQKIDAVYKNNQDMAGGTGNSSSSGSSSSGGSSGGSASGGSSGGGDSGLGSIFATLFPMGVMVATPLVTAWLQNQKDHNDKHDGTGAGSAPLAGSPAAPTDPNAAAPPTAQAPAATAPTDLAAKPGDPNATVANTPAQ